MATTEHSEGRGHAHRPPLHRPTSLWSGLGKIGGFAGFASGLAGQGLPVPTLAALVAIVLEAGGAALVILGVLTRPAAAGLICSPLPQRFWPMISGRSRPPSAGCSRSSS